MESTLSLEHINEASSLIDPVFRDSPQFIHEELGHQLGIQLLVKVECLNPIRSFKGRGAEYFMSRLESFDESLVSASAGNFGQGLAYAARKRGARLTVFASEKANTFKVERMRALGAEVRLVGEDFDEAKEAARESAKHSGSLFVEDGREPAISEGAGTIAVELCRWHDPLDAVLVPVGNGALITGVGRWMKAHSPRTRIIGVGAEGAPAMERSFRSGTCVNTDTVHTIADGVAVRVPVPEAVAEMAHLVDDMVLVDEEKILEAMRVLFLSLGLAVEGAGAVTLAALTLFQDQLAGKSVAILICGGNLTPEDAPRLLCPP